MYIAAGITTQASSQACQHSRNSCIFASCHHRLSRIKEYKYMYQTTLKESIVDSSNLDLSSLEIPGDRDATSIEISEHFKGGGRQVDAARVAARTHVADGSIDELSLVCSRVSEIVRGLWTNSFLTVDSDLAPTVGTVGVLVGAESDNEVGVLEGSTASTETTVGLVVGSCVRR